MSADSPPEAGATYLRAKRPPDPRDRCRRQAAAPRRRRTDDYGVAAALLALADKHIASRGGAGASGQEEPRRRHRRCRWSYCSAATASSTTACLLGPLRAGRQQTLGLPLRREREGADRPAGEWRDGRKRAVGLASESVCDQLCLSSQAGVRAMRRETPPGVEKASGRGHAFVGPAGERRWRAPRRAE